MLTSIRKIFSANPPTFIQFSKSAKNYPAFSDAPTRPVLFTHSAIQDLLDIEFDNKFSTSEVPEFFAWTQHKVYFLHECGGDVRLKWVPRSPYDELP